MTLVDLVRFCLNSSVHNTAIFYSSERSNFNLSTVIRGYCLCVTESGFNLCVKSGLKQESWENDHQQHLQHRKCVHVFVLTESESGKISIGNCTGPSKIKD